MAQNTDGLFLQALTLMARFILGIKKSMFFKDTSDSMSLAQKGLNKAD